MFIDHMSLLSKLENSQAYVERSCSVHIGKDWNFEISSSFICTSYSNIYNFTADSKKFLCGSEGLNLVSNLSSIGIFISIAHIA